jgi:Bacteriophage Lambda NinG protein
MRRSLEQMTHGELERLLDDELSLSVRAGAAAELDLQGYVPCYTCGRMHHWKQLDAGHYIGRSNRGTRFDRRNVRPQCTRCNSFEEGQHWLFRKTLVAELGAEEVEALEALAAMWGASKHPREWLLSEIGRLREENRKLRRSP